MADIDISQVEADALIAMEKIFVDENDWIFPAAGERLARELTSMDKRETFVLDITRAQIKLSKATYQNRARSAIILMRLDLDGPPHRNPDGQEIPCPHLHIYREGYGDKWVIRRPSIATQTPAICSPPVKRSCNTATLRDLRRCKRGFSHDARSRDRTTSQQLPRLAEG